MKRMFHYIKAIKQNKGKNPFAVSFVYYAAICCLFLGIVFLFVLYDRESQLRDEYLLEKVDLVLTDLETQVESFDLAALDISHDKRFYYSVLAENKYNEFAMVQVFRDDYKNMIGLTKDIFLYYKDGSSVFHVNGSLIDIGTYLRVMPEEEQATLIQIMNEMEGDEVDIIPMSDALYMLQPFGAGTHHDAPKAILGAAISHKELENRIKMVSGGLKGKLTLTMGEKQLYCNAQSESTEKQKDGKESALQKTSPKGMFAITYMPETDFFSWELQKNQYLLMFVDMILVFILAWLFAQKAYKPLRELRDKLQSENILTEETHYENVFEEMGELINNALQQKIFSAMQITQMQEMLRQQLLKQLLSGTILATETQSYLRKLGVSLKGPYYYVVCIAFEKENEENTILCVQKDLEQLSISNAAENVYVVNHSSEKQLWVLCCLENPKNKEKMVAYVREVAENYVYRPVLGIGRVYNDISKISASLLESVDNLDKQRKMNANTKGTIYDNYALQKLENVFSTGTKGDSLEELDKYVENIRENCRSMLMQQYIFADFLGFINKISRINRIELSNQSISLLVSAKNIDGFYEAAKEVVAEYCDKFQEQHRIRNEEEALRICQYIEDHYMDYDISIEKIVEELDVTAVMVRESVPEITGKTYKDYVVGLRMEYAKQLLLAGDLSVAEISLVVGYSSVSYFIRIFKEETGITPAKYMKLSSSDRGENYK